MAINLSKGGDQHKIDLTKGKTNITVHANLNWNQPIQEKKGFFGKLFGGGNSGPDLDLGCMYEMQNGAKGVIQPLGGNFGNKSQEPFVFLDKDDRSGSASDGENMYVFKPELVKRVMFFALIYEGASNFQSVGGKMTFKISNGEIITLSLNNPDSSSVFCAAALFENKNGDYFLTKEERYFGGHEQADGFYRFGFRWTTGSK
jgi:tellurite resistance protein TerA